MTERFGPPTSRSPEAAEMREHFWQGRADEIGEEYTQSSVEASDYDEATAEGGWDSPERAQKLVEAYIGKQTLVLDIGTGTGQAVKGYTDKGAGVVAVDSDPKMLEEAEQANGEKCIYRFGDINGKLPIDDIEGYVDVVQAIGVLEFAKDLGDVMSQVERVLAPGGIFVFTVEEPGPDGRLSEHFEDVGVTTYRHTTEEVLGLLGARGLTVISDEAYGGYNRGGDDKVPYHIYLVEKSQQPLPDGRVA